MRKLAPSMPILNFSIFTSKDLIEEARKIGVKGYVKKESDFEADILDQRYVLTLGVHHHEGRKIRAIRRGPR